MKITAPDLKELGIIDEIIPEVKGGAHRDSKEQASKMEQVLTKSLKHLLNVDADKLIRDRYQKFKKMGKYTEEKSYEDIQV